MNGIFWTTWVIYPLLIFIILSDQNFHMLFFKYSLVRPTRSGNRWQCFRQSLNQYATVFIAAVFIWLSVWWENSLFERFPTMWWKYGKYIARQKWSSYDVIQNDGYIQLHSTKISSFLFSSHSACSNVRTPLSANIQHSGIVFISFILSLSSFHMQLAIVQVKSGVSLFVYLLFCCAYWFMILFRIIFWLFHLCCCFSSVCCSQIECYCLRSGMNVFWTFVFGFWCFIFNILNYWAEKMLK